MSTTTFSAQQATKNWGQEYYQAPEMAEGSNSL